MRTRFPGVLRKLALTVIAAGLAFVVADTAYRIYTRVSHGGRTDPRWDLYYYDNTLGANWHFANALLETVLSDYRSSSSRSRFISEESSR